MRIIVLGCGTSTGVPVIGCHCAVCASTDPRNKRTRSSALVQTGGKNLLIDTSTDLRAQSLANGIERIDAVLFTHPHADHIHGIDDLRSFNLHQEGPIPCYGNAFTIDRIKVMFDYIFRKDGRDGWKPNLTTSVVDSAFDVFGIKIIPVEIFHGEASIFGYRIGKFAYLTDCSSIPAETIEMLKGVEVIIIGALRYKPHPTHFSVQQAIEASKAIGAKRTILTHLSHGLDYTADAPGEGVELACDGLTIDIP